VCLHYLEEQEVENDKASHEEYDFEKFVAKEDPKYTDDNDYDADCKFDPFFVD